MKLKVILHPEKFEGGYWIGRNSTEPKGSASPRGDTVEEALANIREAAEGMIEVMNDHGEPFRGLERRCGRTHRGMRSSYGGERGCMRGHLPAGSLNVTRLDVHA